MTISGILFDKDSTLLDYDATWMPLNKQAALAAAGGDARAAERLLVATGYDPASDSHIPNSLLVSASNDVIAGSWAALLGTDAGSAFLRTRRLVRAADDRPIEQVVCLLDPDFFALHLDF